MLHNQLKEILMILCRESSNQNFQGESSIPTYKGGETSKNKADTQSEVEEVNVELNPDYDLN